MYTDPIADVLTRIRNAQKAGHKSVYVRKSHDASNILEVLKKEGFIQGYKEKKVEEEAGRELIDVQLKYYSSGLPLISLAKRISKPGRRVYVAKDELPHVFSGLGISVISTSKGVISDREARKLGVGGELWANIG